MGAITCLGGLICLSFSLIFFGKNDRTKIINLAKKIVEEYDKEYDMILKIDKYKMISENLKSNSEEVYKFLNLMEKKNYWYDITMK